MTGQARAKASGTDQLQCGVARTLTRLMRLARLETLSVFFEGVCGSSQGVGCRHELAGHAANDRHRRLLGLDARSLTQGVLETVIEMFDGVRDETLRHRNGRLQCSKCFDCGFDVVVIRHSLQQLCSC